MSIKSRVDLVYVFCRTEELSAVTCAVTMETEKTLSQLHRRSAGCEKDAAYSGMCSGDL